MVLVFDIGATQSRFGIAEKGLLTRTLIVPTDTSRGGISHAIGLMRDFTRGEIPQIIAGGLPGYVREDGKLDLAPNLPQWQGTRIGRQIGEVFDCSVEINNDAVLAGLGESHDGAGIVDGVMAYFTFSTGINAVRLVDGVVDATIDRYGIGEQVIDEVGLGVRTLEDLTGGGQLEKSLGRRPEDIDDESIWAAEERHLAHGMYNTILHWAPEVVVCGGGMMNTISLEGLEDELHKLPLVSSHWPRLARAALGDKAGLHGAVIWLRQLGYELS